MYTLCYNVRFRVEVIQIVPGFYEFVDEGDVMMLTHRVSLVIVYKEVLSA